MDAIIIIAIILFVAFYYRKVDKIVTGVAIVDIFLRIFHYLVVNIEINGISEHIEKYHMWYTYLDICNSYGNILRIYNKKLYKKEIVE